MSRELSVDLGTIGVDRFSDVDSQEEQDQAERDRELNGLLSQAFDDLSSVSDEDEDRASEVGRDHMSPQLASHLEDFYRHDTVKNFENAYAHFGDDLQSPPTRTPSNYLSRKSKESEKSSSPFDEGDGSEEVIRKMQHQLERENRTVPKVCMVDREVQTVKLHHHAEQDNVRLKNEIKLLKDEVEVARSIEKHQSLASDKIKEMVRSHHALLEENQKLKSDLGRLQQDLKNLEKSQRSQKRDSLDTDKIKKMVQITTDVYKEELQNSFKARFDEELRKANENLDNQCRQRISEARDEWNSELRHEVSLVGSWLNSLYSDLEEPSENEVQQLIHPVKKLWAMFSASSRKLLSDMELKRKELQQAKEELDDALNESKEADSPAHEELFHEYRQAMKRVNEQLEEMKDKLSRYKRKYYQTLHLHDEERSRMRKEFAELLALAARNQPHNLHP
ncbi:hypothetical protein HDE_13678 [Halotydeus destructor]|nr:hypothetical protein HDE_13678 [Halotydeus destructor]